MGWFKRKPSPTWFSDFIEEVATFQASLPDDVHSDWRRDRDYFELRVEAPSSAHRLLALHGDEAELEYSLGKVWTERLTPTPELCNRLLAHIDAVRRGAVREARDPRTGVIYHVYRLRTRGLDEFSRDGQYSMWEWLKLKILSVQIHRIPPLDTKTEKFA